MSRKTHNKLLKPFGIDRARITFCATGERYTNPELRLLSVDGDAKVRVRFQSHRLDLSDPINTSVAQIRQDWRRPDDRFDFGPNPYSACYAGKFEPAYSYSIGNLSAEIHKGDSLRQLARLLDTVERTVACYNLRLVAPNCELALWFAALEKLGAPCEVERWVSIGPNARKLDQYAWRNDLPEDQRQPARDFYGRIAADASKEG